MDIANSFGYVFEDEDWGGKVLIGGLISLVPIANVATIGYALRTMKHVAAGAPRPLPAWENLGDDVVKGLLVAAACAVYARPLFLLLAMTTLISALSRKSGSA